jgi:dTDP-4-dehydrorhamnose reductase
MVMKIKRIAIIGASGFLGSKLFDVLSKKFNVIGTFFSKPSPGLVYLDITDKQQVKSFFKTFDPDLVINCAGITKPDVCEINPKLAYKVNVEGVANMASFSPCKVIHFSSDYVFSGDKGFYTENDKPHPINYYGYTKLKSENIVLDSNPDNVVIRVSGLYGYNKRNNEFLSSFNFPEVYKATDLYGSTLLIDDIIIHLPFFCSAKGLYHLASGNAISRYDFALMAVRILGLSTKVIGKPANEIYSIAKRPRNSSLISVKHNLKIHNEEEGLKIVKNQIKNKKEYWKILSLIRNFVKVCFISFLL